jgi:hypothetical protein
MEAAIVQLPSHAASLLVPSLDKAGPPPEQAFSRRATSAIRHLNVVRALLPAN